MRFVFRLADSWGCSVAEVLGRVSSLELTYWLAYYQLGDDWLQTATLCSAIYGSQGVKCSVQDFLPRYGPKVIPWQVVKEGFASYSRQQQQGRVK